MKEKNIKYLQELLENSEISTSKETLKKLARDMVPPKQFNVSLQHKFQMDNFDSSNVISKMLSLWISFKGLGATLSNFEKILRHNDLNAEAGKY